MFSVRRSWRAAWEWMRHSRQQFLNPYQFFRLSDYWFTVREAWRQARMPHEAVRLGDLEVTRLFEAERDRTTFDADALEAILCYCLPHRLAEAGYFVDVLIDPFENMIPEKSLILGFRRYLPATMLVGFQHAALYPFMLCNFITASEAKFAPMPDRIVCNGEFFREVLVREGLPAERAVTGPSLRYGHLWQLAERPLPPRAAPAIVFVPLPLMLPEAVELILKICRALEDLPGIRVYLKPHPMSSLKTLLKAAHLEHLPAHFEFVGGGMGEWLAQAHVAVGMSSSTVYEIVAAGVPLVVVGRETGLELNPLSWYPEWRQVYVAPEDIRAEVARWLDASPEELEAYRRRARQILTASFKQITDDTLQVFIEGLPTREGNLT
jgi:surface carbohydrate biosynthesis protein (TIGR04326 family)